MGKPLLELAPEQQSEITGRIAQSNPDGWTGPPAPLFYFAVRNDALDVVYGTVKALKALACPTWRISSPPAGGDEASRGRWMRSSLARGATGSAMAARLAVAR